MKYFGMSDVGKIRKNNEDSFYVKAYDDKHMLAIVADGMGGYKRSGNTYVRFDEHGLYGIEGQPDFDPKEATADGKTGVDKINEEAKFALTWDGFALNSSNKEGLIRLPPALMLYFIASTSTEYSSPLSTKISDSLLSIIKG